MVEIRNPGLIKVAASVAISAAMFFGIAGVVSADRYMAAEPAPAVFASGGEDGSGAVFQLADNRRDRRHRGKNYRDRRHDRDRDRRHHGKQRKGRYAHIPERCFKQHVYSASCDRFFEEADRRR
ncbi:MAG: hypothetical protein LBQ79_08600 [Deltaproteobacteria bacterium]|jgi:hypothetical protein|nr:hypothetical protein [Deltaproteobacteria bacterium]